MEGIRSSARVSVHPAPISRRVLAGRGGALAAAALLAPPALGRAVAGHEAPSLITGVFIGGNALDSHSHAGKIFVAVLADAPDAATGATPARAYLCNGQDMSQWFVGERTADAFSLTNDAGAAIEVTLGADQATGTFTLPDGAQHDFAAAAPTGRGGLYTLYLREDGTGFGVSTTGIALDLDMSGEVATGTFLFPDGTLEELEAPVLGAPTGAVYVRLLVQDVAETHMRGSTFQPPAVQIQQVQAPRTQYVWMCLD